MNTAWPAAEVQPITEDEKEHRALGRRGASSWPPVQESYEVD